LSARTPLFRIGDLNPSGSAGFLYGHCSFLALLWRKCDSQAVHRLRCFASNRQERFVHRFFIHQRYHRTDAGNRHQPLVSYDPGHRGEPCLGDSLADAPMAVNILPRCFNVVLIIGRQIQFVQCVGIVVRRKQAGTLHPHLSPDLRAVILWRLDCLFKYDFVSRQRDRDPLL